MFLVFIEPLQSLQRTFAVPGNTKVKVPLLVKTGHLKFLVYLLAL